MKKLVKHAIRLLAGGGGGYGDEPEPIYYTALSTTVLTLGLLLIVEILTHQLQHASQKIPFYKALVEQLFRELATLGIVELFLHLLHEYYTDLNYSVEGLFGDVHYVIFFTAIFHALQSAIVAFLATRLSYSMWVKTEEVEISHYVEIRIEFDRLHAFLYGDKNNNNNHDYTTNHNYNDDDKLFDNTDNNAVAAVSDMNIGKSLSPSSSNLSDHNNNNNNDNMQQRVHDNNNTEQADEDRRRRQSVWNIQDVDLDESVRSRGGSIRGGGRSSHGSIRESSIHHDSAYNESARSDVSNNNNYGSRPHSQQFQYKIRKFLKQVYDTIRYPRKKMKYNYLLLKVRFHELRIHLLKSNNLPIQLKVSGYLMRSEQAVLISFINVGVSTWLSIMSIANVLYFVCGIITAHTSDNYFIGGFFSYLYFASLTVAAVYSILVYWKMQNVFIQIMQREFLLEEEHDDEITEKTKDRLEKEQLDLFWFGKPEFIPRSMQLIQVGFAIYLSSLIVFWDSLHWESVAGVYVYISPLFVLLVLWILIMAHIIPQYTLCTGLGRLVDKQRLHETLAIFNLKEAEKRRHGQLEAIKYGLYSHDDSKNYDSAMITAAAGTTAAVGSKDDDTEVLSDTMENKAGDGMMKRPQTVFRIGTDTTLISASTSSLSPSATAAGTYAGESTTINESEIESEMSNSVSSSKKGNEIQEKMQNALDTVVGILTPNNPSETKTQVPSEGEHHLSERTAECLSQLVTKKDVSDTIIPPRSVSTPISEVTKKETAAARRERLQQRRQMRKKAQSDGVAFMCRIEEQRTSEFPSSAALPTTRRYRQQYRQQEQSQQEKDNLQEEALLLPGISDGAPSTEVKDDSDLFDTKRKNPRRLRRKTQSDNMAFRKEGSIPSGFWDPRPTTEVSPKSTEEVPVENTRKRSTLRRPRKKTLSSDPSLIGRRSGDFWNLSLSESKSGLSSSSKDLSVESASLLFGLVKQDTKSLRHLIPDEEKQKLKNNKTDIQSRRNSRRKMKMNSDGVAAMRHMSESAKELLGGPSSETEREVDDMTRLMDEKFMSENQESEVAQQPTAALDLADGSAPTNAWSKRRNRYPRKKAQSDNLAFTNRDRNESDFWSFEPNKEPASLGASVPADIMKAKSSSTTHEERMSSSLVNKFEGSHLAEVDQKPVSAHVGSHGLRSLDTIEQESSNFFESEAFVRVSSNETDALKSKLSFDNVVREEDEHSVSTANSEGGSDSEDVPECDIILKMRNQHNYEPAQCPLRAYFISARYRQVSNIFGTMFCFFYVGMRIDGFLAAAGILNEANTIDFDLTMAFWLEVSWLIFFMISSTLIIYLWHFRPLIYSVEQRTAVVAAMLDLVIAATCFILLFLAESFRCGCKKELPVSSYYDDDYSSGGSYYDDHYPTDTYDTDDHHRNLLLEEEFDLSMGSPCCPFGSRTDGYLGNIEPFTGLILFRLCRFGLARKIVEVLGDRNDDDDSEDEKGAGKPIDNAHENKGLGSEKGTAVELWELAVSKFPDIVEKHGEFSAELLQAMLGIAVIEQDTMSKGETEQGFDPSCNGEGLSLRSPTALNDDKVRKLTDKKYARLSEEAQDIITAGRLGRPVLSSNDLTRYKSDESEHESAAHQTSADLGASPVYPNERLERSMRRCYKKFFPFLQKWTPVDIVMTRYEIIYFEIPDETVDQFDCTTEALIATKGGKGLRLCDVAKCRKVIAKIMISDIIGVYVDREHPIHDSVDNDEFDEDDIFMRNEFWQPMIDTNSKFPRPSRHFRWKKCNRDSLNIETISGHLHLRFFSDLEDCELHPERMLEDDHEGALHKNSAFHWAQTLVRFCGPEQLHQPLPNYGTNDDKELRDYLHIVHNNEKTPRTHRRGNSLLTAFGRTKGAKYQHIGDHNNSSARGADEESPKDNPETQSNGSYKAKTHRRVSSTSDLKNLASSSHRRVNSVADFREVDGSKKFASVETSSGDGKRVSFKDDFTTKGNSNGKAHHELAGLSAELESLKNDKDAKSEEGCYEA